MFSWIFTRSSIIFLFTTEVSLRFWYFVTIVCWFWGSVCSIYLLQLGRVFLLICCYGEIFFFHILFWGRIHSIHLLLWGTVCSIYLLLCMGKTGVPFICWIWGSRTGIRLVSSLLFVKFDIVSWSFVTCVIFGWANFCRMFKIIWWLIVKHSTQLQFPLSIL